MKQSGRFIAELHALMERYGIGTHVVVWKDPDSDAFGVWGTEEADVCETHKCRVD